MHRGPSSLLRLRGGRAHAGPQPLLRPRSVLTRRDSSRAPASSSSPGAAAIVVADGARSSPPPPRPFARRRGDAAARGSPSAVAARAATDGATAGDDKRYDVVGVSNLCVDVVLPVDALPPRDAEKRRALLARLSADPPSADAWEVGGSCNFMIAAARLGLRVAAVGHTGADAPGEYLERVLLGEGIGPVLQIAPLAGGGGGGGGGGGDSGGSGDGRRVVASGSAGAAAALAAALPTGGQEQQQQEGQQRGVLASAAAAATAAAAPPSASQAQRQQQTLLCFVLVDPAGGHAFCSAYDFGPWPLLMGPLEASAEHRRRQRQQQQQQGAGGLGAAAAAATAAVNNNDNDGDADDAAAERLLPPAVLDALRSTRALYLNGFVFDELPLSLVRACCRAAARAGAAVFFDPGPRAHTMRSGERRAALDAVLDLADVVLMTEEEAAEVTGQPDAAEAARATLARPGCRTTWAVVKRGAEGAVLVAKGGGAAASFLSSSFPSSSPHSSSPTRTYSSPAVPVAVRDTVGCGDSFAAAAVLGFTRGSAPEATLALANAVGAATAMGRGAGTNVASAPRVLELLEGRRRAAAEAAAAEGAATAGGGSGGGGKDGDSSGGAPPGAVVAGAIHMLLTSLDGGSSAGGSSTSTEVNEAADAAVAAAAAAAKQQQLQQQQQEQQQQQQQQPRRPRAGDAPLPVAAAPEQPTHRRREPTTAA